MELHQDDLFRLEYAIEQNMLLVDFKSERFNALDFKKIFACIVACTRERNIASLLLDFSNAAVDMSEKDYKEAISRVAVGLLFTHILKVARIESTDLVREYKVYDTYEQIRQGIVTKYEFQNFSTRHEAIHWLTE